jgi:mannose-6-phosphate isomerase-like protein (cupin superfamily)
MTAKVEAFAVEPIVPDERPWRVLASSDLIVVGEARMPPLTAGPPLHVHTREDEIIYVIEGTLTVVAGEKRFEVGPGGLGWLPRDVPHAFANLGTEPLWSVGMIVPSGLQGMFEEQAAYLEAAKAKSGSAIPYGDPETTKAFGEIAARYGVTFLGPPLPIPATQ